MNNLLNRIITEYRVMAIKTDINKLTPTQHELLALIRQLEDSGGGIKNFAGGLIIKPKVEDIK